MLKFSALSNLHLKQLVLFVIISVLISIYYFFDPSKDSFFIGCPLKTLTGYECAGCGTQRALHELLHFNLQNAFKFNPLFTLMFFLSIIYVTIRIFGHAKTIRKVEEFLFNKKSVVILMIIILVFSLLKNTLFYKAIIESI